MSSAASLPITNSELNNPTGANGWGVWIIIGVLLVLGLWHRASGLETYPFPLETADEYHYAWAGFSILDSGHPVSWSWLPCYGETVGENFGMSTYRGFFHPIVAPALDHPPLFSVLVAVYGKTVGVRLKKVPFGDGGVVWEFSLLRLRTLSLILYAFTHVLLAILALTIMSRNAALLSVLMFTFWSYGAVHHRLLVTENLTTPLLLLELIVLERYLRGKASELVFACVTTATIIISIWCKLVACIVVVPVVVLLIASHRVRACVWPVIALVIAGIGIAAWGWWNGWSNFADVQAAQAARFAGFFSVLRGFHENKVVSSLIHDHLVTACWLSLFAVVWSGRGSRIFWVPILMLCTWVFFADANNIYGWHQLYLTPFLCMALVAILAEVWKSPTPGAMLIIAMLGIPASFDALADIFGRHHLDILRWIYVPVVGFCLIFLPLAKGKQLAAFSRAALVIIGLVVMLGDFTVFRNRGNGTIIRDPSTSFENESFNAVVSGQRFMVGQTIARLFDSDSSTYWSADATEASLEFSFHEPQPLKTIRFEATRKYSERRPRTVSLFHSTDKASWSSVVENVSLFFPEEGGWVELSLPETEPGGTYRLDMAAPSNWTRIQLSAIEFDTQP